MASGLLNTFAPCLTAADSNQVVLRYSISNGGSVRIKTAEKVFRARASISPNENQDVPLGLIAKDWQSAVARFPLQSKLRLWQNHIR